MKRFISVLFILALVFALVPTQAVAKGAKNIHINVLLNTEITDEILEELVTYGKVIGKLEQINALTMKVSEDLLAEIQALPFVEAANPDAERNAPPIDTVPVEDFVDGLSTWNLDAINVTDFGFDNRQVDFDGTGVYVAVIDTGLVNSWRQYFPQERIATEYAKSFGGGGGEQGNVSEQPNKWEHDTNSHGTHVTSTIIGYSFGGTPITPINGVAPLAKIIPVKVLNQNGSGWSSVVARGIEYIGDLKAGPLAEYPVVINMSLGGPALDAVEQAAIDYAIEQGVIIVASAGNNGELGMGYPGAYAPVISVAASGWTGEWLTGGWWLGDVADPTNPDDFYITDFSSREMEGEDLDIAAPGSWIVGPYQLNMGQTSYYYLGGTSMASPHVAGIAALMAEKEPSLNAFQVEAILESSAIPLPADCRDVFTPYGFYEEFCWGADATGAGLATADAALDAIP
ncbi:MAG: S8 family serine peptidase [Anaerolineales bacterium]